PVGVLMPAVARHPLRLLLTLAPALLAGCSAGPAALPEVVWGKRGVQNGDLVRPRAIAIGPGDRLYVVDFTARIQAYDRAGRHLGLTWPTPASRAGRPSALGIDRHGNLIVADSHYHCFRIYSPEGKQLRCLGAPRGSAPGPLGYVSDVVQDDDGYFYVAEFGEVQRIT